MASPSEPLERDPDLPQTCISWSNSTECDSSGKYPSVSINSHGIVVAVYNRGCIRLDMRSKVGKRTGNMHGRIAWGNSENFGKGSHPTVSVNDDGTVVVVYKSRWRRKLFYRVGNVSEKNLRITWSGEPTDDYDSGMRPVVALNNKGQVLEMHMTSRVGSFSTFYRVGTLQEDSITWSNNSLEYRSGKRVQVALNDNGIAVEIHEQAPLNRATVCAVGRIQSSDSTTAKVRWGSMFILGRGSNPHIAINKANQVVEVHETGFRDVFYSGGVAYPQAKAIAGISDDKEYESHKLDLCGGISPAVAINDDGNIVFVCKTSNPLKRTLLCHTGTWAKDNN